MQPNPNFSLAAGPDKDLLPPLPIIDEAESPEFTCGENHGLGVLHCESILQSMWFYGLIIHLDLKGLRFPVLR
jgi:hypothetical protein